MPLQPARSALRPACACAVVLASVGLCRSAAAVDAAERSPAPVVEYAGFSARHERSADGDRVSVSLQLRATGAEEMPCFVFVVVRNEESSPKVWAVWPPQSAGDAISAGGYFHAANPSAGHALTLTPDWQRVTATVSETQSATPYDTAVVYVVAPSGSILLARPFKM